MHINLWSLRALSRLRAGTYGYWLGVVVALLATISLNSWFVPSLGMAASNNSVGDGALISLEANSQDVKTVLQQIAAMAGVNVVIDDTLATRVTLRLQDVEFERALQVVAKAAGAVVTNDDGLYLVLSSRTPYALPEAPPEQTAVQLFDLSQADYVSGLALIKAVAEDLEVQAFPELKAIAVRGPYSKVNAVKVAVDAFLRDRSAGSVQDRSLQVLPLFYADATEVATSLQAQSSTARIIPVRGSNSLVISGTPSDLASTVAAVRQLDRTPALISFDVEVVEVNSDNLSSVGVEWLNGQGQPGLTIAWKEAEATPALGQQLTESLLGWRPWIRSSLQILTQMHLLEEKGEAKVLARPSLTTLENNTARIITGDRYTIVINQGSGGSSWQQLQYIDAGVRLELTPHLDADGSIVVSLTPQVSSVTGFSREGYPVMSTREAQATVRLRNGETLVLGGLIRQESSNGRADVPGLASLPVFGSFFGSTRETGRKTEVVILVTPRVISKPVAPN